MALPPWTSRRALTERAGPAPPAPHLTYRSRPFRPAGWLPWAHAQTVLGKWLRPDPDPGLERVRLDTPDSDFLDLDLAPEPAPGAPIVLLLHGLEGSTRRRYMRVAMAEAASAGLRAVGMNFRSCSGTPNLQPRFYHSGETGDLAFVLEYLAERFPGRPIGILGFSLGGNVLLRFLGERGDAPPSYLKGAAAISVPYDLTEGTRRLEEGRMGRVYSHYFLSSLQAKARAKQEILAPVVDLDRVFAARTVREFDQVATAPLHGFSDAWEYYREASSGPLLPQVQVPTLLLHAFDDPFLPPDAVPRRAVEENPWLRAAFHPKGGHVGFIESGVPWRPTFWAEREAARYLGVLLGTIDEASGSVAEGTVP